MSLINEALKKARVEAARQHAIQRGLPHAPLPQHMPRRRGSRSTNWILVAVVMVLAVAILVLVVRSPAERETSADEPAAGVSSDENVTVDEALAEVGHEDRSPGSTGPSRSAPEVGARAGATEPAVELESVQPAQPLETAQTTAVVSKEEPPSSRELTYAVEARLPNGKELTLDFIVWSQSKPFAQINGSFVEVGGAIEGFTIEAIEPDAVRLRGAVGVVVLKSQ